MKIPKKNTQVATSLRINKSLLKIIDANAEEIERSRNWMVNKLLTKALAEYTDQKTIGNM
ncbi:MAG: ribbon-helix-helix domain-containing protein [Lentisphaeraceae bacterium]|nr:ribbon-helix-helix domain-containing protein [Lentisphaeraceae bacterium]